MSSGRDEAKKASGIRLRHDGLNDGRIALAPGGPSNRRIMVTGCQVHCPNESVIRHERRIPRGAAISYMSDGPYDVRPQLLLMFLGEDYADPAACARYGKAYLQAWCHRVELPKLARAAEAAAADALVLLYLDLSKGRIRREAKIKVDRYTIAKRAKQFTMSAANFFLLRTKISSVYRERLVEALVLFHWALHKDVLYGTTTTPGCVKWNYGQTGSASSKPEQAARCAA
jgi:hypothetical protein